VRDKYQGSAEVCVRLLRKYASEPLVEIQKLFRLLLFSWWTANGDMHLKNFSLLTTPDGIRRLSPAYDLLCTRLVIPEDTLAMPLGGKQSHLTLRTWLDFAAYCEIPRKATERLVKNQIEALQPAKDLVAASFLPTAMKDQYVQILEANTRTLAKWR
jgi:serine/threonine-protein kinase HipA